MAILKVDKIFTYVISKYIDFVDVFFKHLVVELLEHTRINNYITD